MITPYDASTYGAGMIYMIVKRPDKKQKKD